MKSLKMFVAFLGLSVLGSAAFAQTPANSNQGKDLSNLTPAEKAAWIQANPAEYAAMGGVAKTAASDQPMTAAEKEAWVAAHPAEYAKLTNTAPVRGERPVPVTYVSKAEFDALPANKQQDMMNDANYVVEGITKK